MCVTLFDVSSVARVFLVLENWKLVKKRSNLLKKES